jgi:hypothetical protein
MMEHSDASNLQAALRGYEAARQRLSTAAEPNEVKSAAENYLVAKERMKAAERRAKGEDAPERELTDEEKALVAKAKGEGGHGFPERVDALLEVYPEASAGDVARVTGISLAEVMGIFAQRKDS